ncbi:unnamed protein product [Acanthoscelides obtectus]|uniref:Uncharacterized protein n=1 Tax=Acanthoscelides obtectus TaxID=200917 RepID=A0A9P0K599_ACAOB|nr:unnamed protein product [Acanthoscelides obtectus]CAK1633244.1 hypothetical protein AOBTE_LOCUS8001 [Acanthoscelides obtectus]
MTTRTGAFVTSSTPCRCWACSDKLLESNERCLVLRSLLSTFHHKPRLRPAELLVEQKRREAHLEPLCISQRLQVKERLR